MWPSQNIQTLISADPLYHKITLEHLHTSKWHCLIVAYDPYITSTVHCIISIDLLQACIGHSFLFLYKEIAKNITYCKSYNEPINIYSLYNIPYTVKDFSIWKYPDIDVRNDDFMLSSFLFITKEGIWHPNFSWICQCQVFQATWKKEDVFLKLVLSQI